NDKFQCLSALPGGVKFPDSAGGFHYAESGKLLSITSNRFIHWSTSGDTVQLLEQSLDTNLLNNAVKLKFTHCTVLPGGVSIQETLNNVIVLIATNQSVHRIVLLHPTRMYRSVSDPMQSIFADMGKLSLQDPTHSAIIPMTTVGQTAGPSAATAWLSHRGEAHYALALPAGGIMVVTFPPHNTQGSVTAVELKRSSMMQRLAGWMPSAIRGEQSPGDLALSLAVRELEDDSFIFAICQDHKLRMWSFRDQTCLLEADMLEYMPACKGVKRVAGQGHRLRLAFSSTTGLCLAVYMAVPQRGQFTVLQLVATDSNRYSLDHISSLFSTQETLVDFALTSTDIWGLWVDDSNSTIIKYINFEHNTAGQWNQVFVQPPPEEEVHIGVDQDPRVRPARLCVFVCWCILKLCVFCVLQIYRRGSERIVDLPWETLKKEVTVAVENELQSSVTEFEFSQEEYRQLQVEFWSKFYACCLQYQEAQAMPLGLTISPHTAMVCLFKRGFVSFLLPCFAVDHLYLSYDEYLFSEEETPIAEDPEVGRDILQLVQCLRLVSDAVSGEMAYEMEKALEHLQSPERAAELVLENMLANDNDNMIEDIQNKLQDIRNPTAAMIVLLREMDLETDSETGGDGPIAPVIPTPSRLSQLYGSSTAVTVVCQAVCHMAMTRALFCRDLLILQKLYLRLGDNVFLGGGAQLLQLQQDLIPRSSHLLSSYYLLKHISQSLASTVPMDIIWPSNPGFQFPECLMANCQYTQLQEYVRLIGPWCQVNVGSCRFMLGQCYLANGEGQKALQCFQEAATEVEKEEFLMRLTGAEEEEAASTPRLQYYNKAEKLLTMKNQILT
uniref:Nucleoporin 160 n=1 Tax=Myripristis murdjan TaxID=586833 RepID=A0A667ZYV4_9TELE